MVQVSDLQARQALVNVCNRLLLTFTMNQRMRTHLRPSLSLSLSLSLAFFRSWAVEKLIATEANDYCDSNSGLMSTWTQVTLANTIGWLFAHFASVSLSPFFSSSYNSSASYSSSTSPPTLAFTLPICVCLDYTASDCHKGTGRERERERERMQRASKWIVPPVRPGKFGSSSAELPLLLQ